MAEMTRSSSCPDLLSGFARGAPERTAICSPGRTVTYGTLDRLSAILAGRMAAAAPPGGTVAVRSADRVDHVIALVAALRAGIPWLALDPAAPAARNERIAERCDAVLLPPVRETEPHRPGAGRPDTWAAPPEQALAYIVHTSGTTGEPKGVAVGRGALERHLAAVRETFALTPDDVVLQFSAPYVDVWVEQVLGALTAGARLVIGEHRTPAPRDLAALVRREQVTVMNLPAGYWQEFTAVLPHVRADLASLRLMVCGSDTMPAASAERWERETGVRLLNAYGPTETVITSLVHEVRGQGADLPVPIGRALGPRTAHVLDAALCPAEAGDVGELYIGGEALATGYVARPGLTAERFLPDPFSAAPGARMYRTGDLVRRLPDGTVEFAGRRDDQVKIRGYRIEPGEVENVLARHPRVLTCAVGVREPVPGDRRLAAYVTAPRGAEPTAAELREHLAALLPAYMVPASFTVVPALPLTAGGKVDRAALGAPVPGEAPAAVADAAPPAGAEHCAPPEAASAGVPSDDAPGTPSVTAPDAPRTAGAAEPPDDALESLLREIWSEVLGITDIGPTDNFFLLGGDSLTALRVAGRILETPWAEATVTVFEEPTLRGLAAAMAAAVPAGSRAADGAAGPVRTGATRAPLSGLQRGLWLLTQLDPDTTAYNIPWVFELDGPVDPAALRAALGGLIDRHEALRTVFGDEDGEPCQIVRPYAAVPLAVSELAEDADGAAVEALVAADAAEPFRLTDGPLLRMRLIRHGQARSTLVAVFHHLVWDESSLGVLERDLGELYQAAAAGRAPRLPELPVGYPDYSIWQQSLPQREHLDHWRQRLAGAPRISTPPTDRPRTAGGERVAASLRFTVPPRTARRVRELARSTRSTPYTVLLAGYAALLHRVTGARDLVVGTPVTTRSRPELEGLIGYFVNLVPLRLRFAADSGFGALVEQVKDASFDAFAHQDTPLDAIVGAVLDDRRADADPLFQTIFELHPGADRPVRLGPASGTRRLHAHAEAKFELAWMIEESGDGFQGWIEYDTGLYDRERVERLRQEWLDLLARLTESPDTAIGGDGEPEADTVVADTVVAVFEDWARRTPGAPALLEADSGRAWSYAELDARANRFAHWLRDAGVRVGDTVGLHLPRSARWVAVMLGVLKAGAAYLPLEPHLHRDRLALCVRDTGPAVVVSTDPAVAAGLGARVLDVLDGTPERCPADPVGVAVTAEDGVYLPYTSGSTGTPKGTLVPHRAIPGFFRDAEYAGWGPGSTSVLHSALSWDGHVLDLYPALMTGGRTVVCGPGDDDPLAVARTAADHGATDLFLSPAALGAVAVAEPGLLAGLRCLVVGGDAVPADHFRRVLEAAPGLRIAYGYGPSETTVFATVDVLRPADLAGGQVPVGRDVGDRVTRVLDGSLRPCPPGGTGELYIGGPAVGHGYHDRPGLTARAFVPDPFSPMPGARMYRTGDLVRQLPRGAYEFAGRRDNQIKIRGYRVELGEIENALATHPAVGSCVVVVHEPAPGDKRLAAHLTAKDAGAAPGTAELRAHLAALLPDHMLPATFTVLAALPLTANGKVDRKALSAPAAATAPTTGVAAPPAKGDTELERTIFRAWSQVLGIDDFGTQDNFFGLGGDSLRAVRLALVLARELGTEVPPRLIFACKTVSALAARLA
ncbi:non-ribosomal peptide synthetase [Streptantibioticus silvisoli]|nr:non-ribosomal peptide synthetase [Streptantibioticus silvisoli]